MATGFQLTTGLVLLGASTIGGLLGVGSVSSTPDGRARVATFASDMAVDAGLVRARAPQPGDHWSGCNDARAAGTAPIYAGEPGYRDGMDGDNDGVACEPYHGR